MNVKERAARAITVAIAAVTMTSAAQAAPHVSNNGNAAQTAATDLATNGIAGIAGTLSQYETDAYRYIEMASASVEKVSAVMVASGEEAEDAADNSNVTEETTEINDTENEQTQTIDSSQPVEETAEESTEETTEAEGSQEESQPESEEEELWENRLMPEVNEFLYVRAEADPDAQIVGKLYKGDVAEIEETGSEWTHVKSGNVEGYVNNAYCVTGQEALDYAKETVDSQAEVLTDGLRIRSEADENSAVITAVSEGTVLKVAEDAETDGDWVAVEYNGTVRYASADYVNVSLALGEGVTMEEEQEQLRKLAEEEKKAAEAAQTGAATVQNSAVTASADDVTLLAAIIQCEAGSEVYEGQVAVGAVVMNRVRSGNYPNTIYNVIYQQGQFTPAGSGRVASVAASGPKQSCIQAAQEALNGTDNTAGATRFCRASSGHAGVVIGNHVFY